VASGQQQRSKHGFRTFSPNEIFPAAKRMDFGRLALFLLAARLFFLSTLCVLGLTPAFMRAYENRPANWIGLPWEALGFLVPIGVLFLFFGMLRYGIRIDNSGVWTKRLWLVILLVGFWWGSIPYYYFVYLAQIIPKVQSGDLIITLMCVWLSCTRATVLKATRTIRSKSNGPLSYHFSGAAHL
jgi:hypothetical protein